MLAAKAGYNGQLNSCDRVTGIVNQKNDWRKYFSCNELQMNTPCVNRRITGSSDIPDCILII